MKKLVAVFISMLILAGCGGSSNETTAASSSGGGLSGARPTAAVSGYTFKTGGTVIAMNAEAQPLIEAIGGDPKYFESASCAFEGLDKEYTYSGFVLKTYPVDDKDYVNSVTLYDDSVSTPEGITIGSSLVDVETAYGAGGTATVKEYTMDKSKLLILLEDDSVTSIQYIAITE